MNNHVVCNNCGIRGHVYRECRNPVLSYGNILYRTDKDVPQLLMIQRKDSLCYIEFIRGKYDIRNIAYIQVLIDKCNNTEKQRLLTHNFETLWNDLWMIRDSDEKTRFKSDYVKGSEKFNSIRDGVYANHIRVCLKDIIEQSPTSYPETEWEFPKGRRNPGETNRECAIREFSEETGYNPGDYEYITNIAPLDEAYVGENNVRYKHIYYIGFLKNLTKFPEIDPEKLSQVTEIRDIRWLSKDDALRIIRDYHHTRKSVILRLFEFVDKLNHDYFVIE
jgi:8-oxo-dGTP pyrophosphatase MutT (NUDIX family)